MILDLLTGMNQNAQSIVMVTHDIQAACRADRLILVKDGTIDGILELGKYAPEQLKAREKPNFSCSCQGRRGSGCMRYGNYAGRT
ncbi:hypothetical protein ACFTAO_33875 [Paenibacillus rhizoplanae]